VGFAEVAPGGAAQESGSMSRLRNREPRPFLKWVGGKTQLLSEIRDFMPETFGTYREPFIGGGALFFDVKPKKAVLSDMNERLIRAYRGIKKDVQAVIDLLEEYPHKKKFFLELRAQDIDSRTDAEVAAWMIYLNKVGFNGLYRVNSRNGFNVPFGRYTDPVICDESNLRACAKALRGVTLKVQSFEEVESQAKPGDFVYFDPPYVPLNDTSYFTSYTSAGFDWAAQARLRDLALRLKTKGVFVLLSNSSAQAVYELYGKGFECLPVDARRYVNATGSGRGAVKELLIR